MRERTELTRQRVLDVAESIVLKKSFGSVGINEVLAASGVPKGSFYHYFRSKDDFGVALVAHSGEKYGRVLDDLLQNDQPSARARLLWFMRYHIDYYEANGCTLDCLIVKLSSELSTASENVRKALAAVSKDWTMKFEALVRSGHGDGSIPAAFASEDTGRFIYSQWLGANTQVAVSRSTEPLSSSIVTLDAMFSSIPAKRNNR